MTKPVLITRPAEDAAPLAEAVAALGGAPLLCPLLAVRFLDETLDMQGVQALLFTSANGVRAFARLSERRDLPVYAVGNATGQTAGDAGFQTVHVAAGDVRALATLVREHCDPSGGALFHAAASKLAGDLQGMLSDAGYTVRRETLYRTETAKALSEDAVNALQSDDGAYVLLYSPRTARTFRSLAEAARIEQAMAASTALCLSDAVAAEIRDLPWHAVRLAARPDQSHLLNELEQAMAADMSEDNNPENRETSTATHLTEGVNAEILIEAFGGIRPMATKLDLAVSTVQGWKLRHHIPPARFADIETAAAAHGVDLADVMKQSAEAPAPAPSEPQAQEAPEPTKPEKPATSAKAAKENAEPTSPPTTTIVQRGGNGVAWAAILLSLLAGAATVTQPYWGPTVEKRLHPVVETVAPALAALRDTPPPAAAPADIDALQDRLSALQADMAALKGQLAGGSATQAQLSDLAGQITDLTERLDEQQSLAGKIAPSVSETALDSMAARLADLEQTVDTQADSLVKAQASLKRVASAQQTESTTATTRLSELTARIAAAEARMEEVAAAPQSQTHREVALVVATGQLESRALAGDPFAESVTALDALTTPDDTIADAINALDRLADRGVPTRTQLLNRFEVLARSARETPPPEDLQGWVDATLNNVKNLVSIRRVGDGDDLPPLSRAEAALKADDLATAVDALSKAENLAPQWYVWMQDAANRLTVERAIADIRATAVKRLTKAAVTAESVIRQAPDTQDATAGGNE